MLEEVLSKYVVESCEDFDVIKLRNHIEKEMSGYDVFLFEEDVDSNLEVCRSLMNWVKGKFVEDTQYSTWSTNDSEIILQVVTIKIK